MAEQRTGASQSPFLIGLPLLTGVAVFAFFSLMVFSLLHYADRRERGEQAEKAALQSLDSVRENFDNQWEKLSFLAELISLQIGVTESDRVPAVLRQYQESWPAIGIALYDQEGKQISVADAPFPLRTAPAPHSARKLVYTALTGRSGRDVTQFREVLSLSAAHPVRGGMVRAVVVSLPLDPSTLDMIRPPAASVAVFAFEKDTSYLSTAQTMPPSGEILADIALMLEERRRQNDLPFQEQVLVLPTDKVRVGVCPLPTASGTLAGALFVIPQAEKAGPPPVWRFAVSAVAGLAAVLLMAAIVRSRQRYFASICARHLNALTHGEEFPPDAERESVRKTEADTPEEGLREAFDKLSAILKRCASLAGKTYHSLPDAREQSPDGLFAESRDKVYKRFFEKMPAGAFQMDGRGRFLQVNPALALALGYDAPLDMLAERPTFADIQPYGENLPLASFTAHDGGGRILSLRGRNGKIRCFTMLSAPVFLPGGSGGVDAVEGFLLPRDLEEQTAHAEQEREHAVRERISLALLLAATSRKMQGYLMSVLEAPDPAQPKPSGKPEGAEEANAAELDELRRNMAAVKDILNDIHEIAMTEADSSLPTAMPVNLGRFMKRLCRQSLPGLTARGISLFCETAKDLPGQFRGSAPMLRHALLRALRIVSSSAYGGRVCISVTRDPNSPDHSGESRLLFSVSWSSYEQETDVSSEDLASGRLRPDTGFVVLNAHAPEGNRTTVAPPAGVLDMDSEQEMIRYLVRKMRGELLEGKSTDNLRSIQFIVTLEHSAEGGKTVFALDDEPSVYPEKAEEPFSSGYNSEAPLPEETVPLPPRAEPGSPVLELLAVKKDVHAADDAAEDRSVDAGALDILLVDDNLNNRLLFSLLLRDKAHRVTVAYDGQEGVEVFQRGRYDVIFMNMEMPLMDGYQATRIIRALEVDRGQEPTPIVSMTTYALPELREQCVRSGCSDFLTRPFGKNALLTMLESVSRLKAARTDQP